MAFTYLCRSYPFEERTGWSILLGDMAHSITVAREWCDHWWTCHTEMVIAKVISVMVTFIELWNCLNGPWGYSRGGLTCSKMERSDYLRNIVTRRQSRMYHFRMYNRNRGIRGILQLNWISQKHQKGYPSLQDILSCDVVRSHTPIFPLIRYSWNVNIWD